MLLRATVYGVVLSVITAAGVVAQEVRVTPGPLEKQAKQVTPENPVPRRLSSKPVDYPSEMQRSGGRGVISLQVTLDARGKIAEIRNTQAQLVQATGPVTDQQTTDALMQSAIDAVREWTFARPAAAPLTFSVAFMFFDGTVDVALGSALSARGRGPAPPAAGAPLPAPWPAAEGAFRVRDVTVPPRKTKDVKPEFPDEAQRKRIGGAVIMEIVIGPDGRVRDARVVRSAPDFDQAALNAVRQWEYTPSLLNGVAVPIVMTATITFNLK